MASGVGTRAHRVWPPAAIPSGHGLAALVAGAGVALTVLATGEGPLPVAVAMDVWFGMVLVILGCIDLRRRVIPNRTLVPAIMVALAYALLSPDQTFASAMGGALLAATPFALLFLVLPPLAMGAGDVKMAGLVGAIAGVPGVFGPLLLATTFAALAALILRGTDKRRFRMIPYGPFLALGGLIALL
ncbi:MAG: A24 family peptidase [Dehalococcoidia bacterium]